MKASILTRSQTKVFRKNVNPGGLFTVTVRYDDECGNGYNSFAITGDFDGSSGCIHDLIAEHFPELAHLIKWNLMGSDGPMHYIANTVYHAGNRDYNGLLKGEFRPLIDKLSGLPLWHIPHAKIHDHVASELPPAPIEWEPWGRTGEGKARDLEAARYCAVWPDATDEQLCSDNLKDLLEGRLPALIEEFAGVIEGLGFTF